MNLPETLVREIKMIRIHKETGYQVTECGKVLRKDGFGYLKGKIDKYGYLTHGLSMGKKNTMLHRTAHRLVAETYIPNPENKPQVNHKDGNKLNNHISNLEWCTAKENSEHKVFFDLQAKGEENGNSVNNEDTVHSVCKMIEDGYRNNDIIKELGVNRKLITDVRNKKTWCHISNGYDFKPIAHQGISNNTFLWICHKLQEGLRYRQILESYTGGDYLTYECLKKIKNRKMRPHLSAGFNF